MKCVAKPLRFKTGQRVLAKTYKGWQEGTIIKTWDEGKAYRVEIDDRRKTNVWAHFDEDACI